jgi:ribonuclease E
MLVGGTADQPQIAVLEEGILVEHFVARKAQRSIAGNIYLGRVQNVLPGMEAAFVDIGQPRNAVLYIGEVMAETDADVEGDAHPRIEQVLSAGQQVVVQVTKDPMGTKGARLTTEISLAGRYLVVVPKGSGTGISKRLDDNERARLRDIARRVRPEGFGVIVRTAGEGATSDELERDLTRLTRLWEEIDARVQKASAPLEIYVEPDLAIRVIRDQFSKDYQRLVIADKDTYERVHAYVQAVDPDLVDRVELHTGPDALFDAENVTQQLRKALERKVWLPSGGQLVIDRTEALTVIDVNTARYVGRTSLEDTVVKTNLEAAAEVVRQLRLRDIGGIIIIDFIDMLLERNREQVLRRFREELERDRTKTQVIGISPLGLVEMTRKRVSEGLVEALSVPCPTCGGHGVVIDPERLDTFGNEPARGEEEPKPSARPRSRSRRRGPRPGATPPAAAAEPGASG